MDTGKPFSIPVRLIVLDATGVVLLGVGLLKVIANIELLPQGLLFEGYGIAFIVVGVLLMIPLVVYVVVFAISRLNRSKHR